MTSDDTSTTGAIHDIGYRHYTGPRLGRAYARTSLAIETLRASYGLGRTLRSKLAPMFLLAFVCLPALIWVTVGAVLKTDRLPVGFLEFLVTVVTPLVSIFAAVLAPSAISRDLRFRTLALYRSRPLGAGDYVLAKLIAAIAAIAIFLCTPMLILYLGGILAGIPWRQELSDFLCGMLGALLLAMWLASFSLLVAALTPRRGVGVAVIVTVLLVLVGAQGFVMGMSDELGKDTLATWSRLISPFMLADGIVEGAFDGDSITPYPPDGARQVAGLAAGYVATVGSFVALLFLRARRGL